MEKIEIRTTKRIELIDITQRIEHIVGKSKIENGVCFIFIPHTTAGVTINENADPSVMRDITNTLNKLIPANAGYSHVEGNSDSHIKSSVLGNSLYIIIEGNHLCLGRWQGIFFAEADGPRKREAWIELIRK